MTQERLLRAGVISLVGAAAGALLNFALVALVGRELGTAQTGSFFTVIGVFVVCANILELGADTGLVRTLPRNVALGQHRDVRKVLWIAVLPVVIVAGLGSVGVYLGATSLAGLLGGSADQTVRAELLQSLTPFILCAALLAVLLGALRGLGGSLQFTLLQNLSLPASRLVLVALAMAVHSSVVAVTFSWAVALPAILCVSAVLLRRAVRRTEAHATAQPATPRRVLSREFWSFSAPRGVAATVEIILEWADVLVVAALRTPAEAGVYAVATRCIRAGQMVEYAARIASSPQISAAAALGHDARLQRIYVSITRAMVLLSWPFYVTLFAFAPTVLSLFGPGFVEGTLTLRVLSVGMMVALGAGALQSVLLMAGRSSWQLRNKASALLVSVVLNLVLVPRVGIVGAALAWLAAIAVDTSLAASQVRKLSVHLDVKEIAPSGLVAVLVFGAGAGAAQGLLGPGNAALLVHLIFSSVAYLVVVRLGARRLGMPETMRLRSGARK